MKRVLIILNMFFVSFSFVSAESVGCVDLGSTLRYGARDSIEITGVTSLQGFLYKNNYLKVNPTGYFGPLTNQAVKSFQRDRGLIVDGIVGPITRGALRDLTCIPLVSEGTNTTVTTPVESIEENTDIVSTPSSESTEDTTVVADEVLTTGDASSLRVRTNGALSITPTSITTVGTITDGARSSTVRWFEMTKNPDLYKLSETKISPTLPERGNNERFYQVFLDLEPNTTYYFRACAGLNDGTLRVCGGTLSVNTLLN